MLAASLRARLSASRFLLSRITPATLSSSRNALSEFSTGVRITVAKDADTAVALLFDPGFSPQLVITDMHMAMGSIEEPSVVLQRSTSRCCLQFRVESSRVAKVLRLGAKEYTCRSRWIGMSFEMRWWGLSRVDATSDVRRGTWAHEVEAGGAQAEVTYDAIDHLWEPRVLAQVVGKAASN